MSMTIAEAIERLKYTKDKMEEVVDCALRHNMNPPNLQSDIEAYAMAIDALREKEERDLKPLTMWELRKMHRQTVYCLELNTMGTVIAPHAGPIDFAYKLPGRSGTWTAMDLTLYRERPKEEHHED